MPASGRFLLPCVLILSLLATACGDDPPENEMQQAQGAIDAAGAAGAAEYAHDEFVAAQDSLKKARQAVTDRDYRLALSNAMDSREHAQTAAKNAADNKAIARAEAERALIEANAALDDARGRLKSGEAAHVSLRLLAQVRRTIAESETSVQEARAAVGRGEFRAASRKLAATTANLQGIAHTLATAPSGATRRRR